MLGLINGACSRCHTPNTCPPVKDRPYHITVVHPWVLITHDLYPGPELRTLRDIPASGLGHRVLCPDCADHVRREAILRGEWMKLRRAGDGGYRRLRLPGDEA